MPQAGDVFAFQQTVLQFDRTTPGSVEIKPATAVMNQGTTVEVVSVPGSGNPTVRIKIDSLGIDQNIELYSTVGTPIGSTGKAIATYQHTATAFLDYTFLGSWIVRDGTTTLADYGSMFATGFHTPLSGKPTTGTATYSQIGGVTGAVFVNGATVTSSDKQLFGHGSVTANFAANTVTGLFTSMQLGSSSVWNDVSLTGTISGVTVSGTTGLGSTPGTTDAFTSATGTFNGGFFGPNAEEIGMVWTLRDVSGSIAIGTFGGAKP